MVGASQLSAASSREISPATGLTSAPGVVGTAGVHQHNRPAIPNALGGFMADTALGAGD